MGELESSGKSFGISKLEVWQAFKQVRANRGAPGVDAESVAAFESDLKNNLYRIWNRMSAGSYFPPPVRAVEIPKGHGGTRVLGVPTVADRVAQTVVARHVEARVEPVFHPDSYAYRPGRSALDAVGVCRRRCFGADWVLHLDIEAFFDSVDHDLLVKAVQVHTDARWVLLYVRRWLTAPLALPDGTLVPRDRGTPQGSAVSPVLANLFLHHAFDAWMTREHPGIGFERYADDVVVHCTSLEQAQRLQQLITDRLASVGLRVHPDKTRIVYCRDGKRRGDYPHTSFEFLGYEFRARSARRRDGTRFTGFLPAVSRTALRRMSRQVRSWRLHRRTTLSLDDLADRIVPVVRGWMNYYGRYYRSALYPLLLRINSYLVRWAGNKYRRLRSFHRVHAWWTGLLRRDPRLFPQWAWTPAFLWRRG